LQCRWRFGTWWYWRKRLARWEKPNNYNTIPIFKIYFITSMIYERFLFVYTGISYWGIFYHECSFRPRWIY
jgi:hypothetical protein